jgi:hypothetical protein
MFVGFVRQQRSFTCNTAARNEAEHGVSMEQISGRSSTANSANVTVTIQVVMEKVRSSLVSLWCVSSYCQALQLPITPVFISNYPCFYFQLPLFLFTITPVFIFNYPCFYFQLPLFLFPTTLILVVDASCAHCLMRGVRQLRTAVARVRYVQVKNLKAPGNQCRRGVFVPFSLSRLIPSHSFDCSSSQVPLLSHLFLRLCLVSCIRDAAAAAPIVFYFLIVLALVFSPFRLRNCFRLLL